MTLDPWHEVVARALAEDAPWGDATSEALVPATAQAEARMVARAPGVIAGLEAARLAFTLTDPVARWQPLTADGVPVAAGTVVATVAGPARSLLRAERVALNLVQRLSGVATLTAAYVAAAGAEGGSARIIDTRKTTPGLRALERHAVRCGGGHNHRWSLSDAVLVKDNHLAALASEGIDMAEALRQARLVLPHTTTIEVEVDRLDQIEEALKGAPDAILLDNFSLDDLRAAVELIAGRCTIEASGGVTLDTVAAISATGVNVISVGALTHSAPALDVALDFV